MGAYAADREIEVAPGVNFAAWTYNDRIPGPTLRCREGELLRITFVNGGSHSHTIHFHGIHPAEMDGVPGLGAGEIAPGERTVYEFEAAPAGLHLYHCHVRPLAEHIAKGLYGTFIVDPKEEREPRRRDGDGAERLRHQLRPCQRDLRGEHDRVRLHERADPGEARTSWSRVYLVNILEYDLVNSFHLHGNLFNYFPTGTSKQPSELTDTVMLCQGQRGILEWRFPYAGKFMFHAHQSEFTELGWQGFFEVAELTGGRALAAARRPPWRWPARAAGLAARPRIPLLLIGGGHGARSPCSTRPGLGERQGPPVEELAVERTVLKPGVIELTVRNDGPDEVRIAQAQVNDAFVQFTGAEEPIGRLATAAVKLQQPWMEGEAYEVTLAHVDRGHDQPRDPRGGGDTRERRLVLCAHGAARRLRRRDPRRAGHAVAAVDQAHPAVAGCGR